MVRTPKIRPVGAVTTAGLVAALSGLASTAAFAVPTVSFAGTGYDTGLTGGSGISSSTTIAGDFTSDAKPDIVVLDFYGFGDPLLMVNQGDGTFPEAPSTRIDVANNGDSLDTVYPADFNADGDLDLLLGNDMTVFVLLGHGDGTFHQSYTASYFQNNQKDAKVDDFNNDGKLDFVFKGPTGVKTWLGNGAGGFASGPASPWPSGSGQFTISGLATGDFNIDGKRDLAVSDAFTGKVYTMIGTGAGAFTQGTSVSVISAQGVVPGTVLVGDYNHDGRDDVAVVNEFTDPLKSFAVALAKPTGGFHAPSFYDGGVNSSTGAVADLNNDGHLDLVASDTTGSQQVVQLGNGNGSFTLGGKFPTNPGAQTPAVADYDADGWLDIASVGSQLASFPTAAELTVLLNTTN